MNYVSNHLSLVEQRSGEASDLSEQIAQYLAANGKIEQLESPPIKPEPAKRSTKIDPETILKRRKPAISAAERKALRKLAEAL